MTTWIRIFVEIIVGVLASYFAVRTKEKQINAKKISTAQKEGLKIASRPSSDRDALLDRMCSGQ